MDSLRKFDGAFDGVPEADSFGGLPDGTYQGRVSTSASGVLLTEDKDGALRARIVLEVVACDDEDQIGRKATNSWTLVGADGALNEIGVSYFKKDMRCLGAEVVKLSDAAGALESVLGAVVQFAVKHKDDKNGVSRENIYLNTLVEAAPAKKTRNRR